MHQHHGLNWLTHTEQWQFQHAFICMTPGGLPPRSCKNNSLVHFRLEVIKLGFLDFCVFISCYSIMLLLNVWFCCVRFSSSLYSTKRMAKKNVSEITYSIHLVAADKDNVRTVQVWRKGPSQSTCMGQQGGAGLSFWVPQVSMSQFTASIHPIQWSDHGIYWSFTAALCMTGAWIIAQSAHRRRLYIANCAPIIQLTVASLDVCYVTTCAWQTLQCRLYTQCVVTTCTHWAWHALKKCRTRTLQQCHCLRVTNSLRVHQAICWSLCVPDRQVVWLADRVSKATDHQRRHNTMNAQIQQ